MINPYTMVFGKAPKQYIVRTAQRSQILDCFQSENPPYQMYLLTGVRGSGKTVLMTEVGKELQQKDDWIVAQLNPDRDLLMGLASELTSNQKLTQIFKGAKLNLSLLGLGVEVSGASPITDVEIALREMLHSLKKKRKKVLITIDEVTNNENVRAFASAFQILVRQDLPVFLLMTGLYENIHSIQDEKNLTFLYRAPKLEMGALNTGAIAANYKETFHLTDERALDMAKITKGYPFAFQVLGYLTWEHDGDYTSVLVEYRQYLEEYVYEKIWSELSAGDRKMVYAIARCPSGKIKDIRQFLEIETNAFNPYRQRLIRKGILDGETYGVVKFVLPCFEQFVLENYE
jgi:hypothetical protein